MNNSVNTRMHKNSHNEREVIESIALKSGSENKGEL